MGGRNNTPLFEALQRSTKSSAIPMHRPAIPPLEPKKAGKGESHIRVPVYAVYIAITVALAVSVTIWAVAFQVGRLSGEETTLRKLGFRDDEPKTDPIEQLLEGASPEPTRTLARPQDPPTPQAPPPLVILATGPSTDDPRKGETNYLQLASGVPEGEARDAIGFLADNALPAMARRVDPGDQDANNPVRYDLFALEPVPSARFGELRVLRESLTREAARLGQLWRKPPHRGTVDFAQPIWVKHTPN